MSIDLIIKGIDEASGVIGGVSKEVGGLQGVMNSAGGIAGGVFKVGMLGAAAGLTAIAGGLVASIGVAGSWANTLDSMQDVIGGTARSNAALAVAIRNVGGNVEGVGQQFTFLARGLETAKGKLGPTGLELEKLGINVYDAKGQLKDVTAIAVEVADKFSKMPDGIEKSAAMTRVMGRSGRDLSDVMNELANGGLKRADEEARALGLSMSDEDVVASKAFDRSMSILQMTVQGFAVTIGTSLVPFLQKAADALKTVLANPAIQNGAKELAIALGLIGDGHVWSGIIHIGEAFGFTEDQMLPLADTFRTLQDIIFNGVIPSVGQLGRVFDGLGDILTGNVFEDTVPNMMEAFQNIGDLLGPVIQGWADIAGPALSTFVTTLDDYLIANLPLWVQAFGQFELAAWAWIEQAIPPMLESANRWFSGLLDWVVSQVPAWSASLMTLVGPATQWILDALPGLAANLGVFTGQLLGFVLQLAIDLAGALIPLSLQFISWIITDVVPQLPGALEQIWLAIEAFLQGMIIGLTPILSQVAARFYLWVTEPGGPADRIGAELNKFQAAIFNWLVASGVTISKAFTSLGGQIMDALGKGITAAIDALIARLNAAVEALKQAFRDATKMFSPSHVFFDYGTNLMQGLAMGITQGAYLPQVALAGAMPQVNMAGAVSGISGSTTYNDIAPTTTHNSPITIHATLNNNMDINDLAQQITMLQRKRGSG